MSRFNTPVKAPPIYTHEGGKAARINPEQQLQRSVLSCFLWEDEFYEDGQTIADRILDAASQCSPTFVASLAVKARKEYGLRSVPLLLLIDLIRRGGGAATAKAIEVVITRADEMAELVAIYFARNPGKDITNPMKKGLAAAFHKFDEYSLAKYDRDGKVLLRDVLRLCHVKAKDEAQDALFKRVIARKLAIPDTWETALSGGADKKETFTRLLNNTLDPDYRDPNGQIFYLALLRNLRNMVQAGVDQGLIERAILARQGARWVFPFRYTAAARIVPQLEPVLDRALITSISEAPALKGLTAVMVDVSSSMSNRLSAKSDLTRFDAAATLGAVINSEQLRLFTFSDYLAEVPPRRGMAGVDAMNRSQQHNGTRLFDAVAELNKNLKYDRLIVITDEQAYGAINRSYGGIQGNLTSMPDPTALGYVINVASAQNGVGYGKWTHIDGFSEAVLRFITEKENDNARAELVGAM